MAKNENEIPPELRQKLTAFDNALSDIETKLDPFIKKSQIELNAELCALDKAKLEIVSAYTINSLFWMYLNVCGINPKEHGIKQELDRIRRYMNRIKEIQEAQKAKETRANLDVNAAKRFVKSSLWEAAKKGVKMQMEEGNEQEEDSQQRSGTKRKSEEFQQRDEPRHKKKKKNKKKKH